MDQRIYRGSIDPNALADHLVGVFGQNVVQGRYYSNHHTMAQKVGEGDQVMVQIMRGGSWGNNGETVGLSITRVPDGVSISMGTSEWLDGSTVAGMVIGAIFFPPLIVLPLLSGLMGSNFYQDIWDVIERYCSWVTARPEAGNVPNYFHCPYCAAYNIPGAIRCHSCNGVFYYPKPPRPARPSQPSTRAEQPVQSSQSGRQEQSQDLPARKKSHTKPLDPAELASVSTPDPQPEPLVIPPEPVAPTGHETVVCQACGTRVAAARFCGNCAAPLRD